MKCERFGKEREDETKEASMLPSRFMVRLILILSTCYLTACAPSPERIAGQTATAEQRAVESTVRAAQRTSRPLTPTPAPAPETLFPVAEKYCDDAFNKDIVSDGVIIESSSLLTLIIRDWIPDSARPGMEQHWTGSWQEPFAPATPFLEASSAQDVQFLICIKEGRRAEGTYTDGAAAYRLTWSVRLVQLSDGHVIGEEFFTGGAPPGTKPAGSHGGYGDPPGGTSILKWLLPYWREGGTVLFHDAPVTSIAFSADGKVLAAGGWGRNNELKLWDVSSGEVLYTLSGHQGDALSRISVAFSPDGSLLASGSGDSTVKLWDVSSGEELRTLSGHEWSVNSVAFSPDGRMLASGSSDDTVKLWDVSSGKELRTLSGHERGVNSIAFSPDGSMLASASDDHTVILWDLASGEALRTLSGHTIAFSPDGDTLASASEDQVILWDVSSGAVLPGVWSRSYTIYTPHHSLAFSPDGSMLASAGRKYTVVLSDAATGMALITLSGHENQVTDVAFSPDGNILASTSGVIVKLWDLTAME
jgi:WD40 repeat protein